jgi:branched-chain amino acid transport system substrate-binding protein
VNFCRRKSVCIRAVAAVAVIGASLWIETTAGASQSATTSWAVKYTGGSAGHANASLTPVIIGATVQIGPAATGPGAIPTIHAAQSYINRDLGGIGGHPVQFDICQIQVAQDAQSCGQKFANDPSVKLVVNGNINTDDSSMLTALAAVNKPVLLSVAINPGELAATKAFNYGPGVPNVYASMGPYIAKQLGKAGGEVSVLSLNVPAIAPVVAALKASLTGAGVKDVTYVSVPLDGTAPEYASAIQAADASQAKAFVINGVDTTCVAAGDALKSLGATPQVLVTENGCMDKLVLQHYGGTLPESWRIFNFGNSPYIKSSTTGVDSYLAAMKEYAPTTDAYTDNSLQFGELLTADRIANSIGYSKLTSAAFMKAARAFTGPAFMEPGPVHCGYSSSYPSVCGNKIPVDRYTGTKYTESIAQFGSLGG